MAEDQDTKKEEKAPEATEPMPIKRDEADIAYSPIFNPAAELAEENPEELFGKWNEADFDEEFDDDFEEEVEGEYELEDDEYGEEFAEVEEMMGMREPSKDGEEEESEED